MRFENNGGPAFPSHGSMGEVEQDGMSLRDYFAAKALQGLLVEEATLQHDGNPASIELAREQYALSIATASYRFADAMLKAREGET